MLSDGQVGAITSCGEKTLFHWDITTAGIREEARPAAKAFVEEMGRGGNGLQMDRLAAVRSNACLRKFMTQPKLFLFHHRFCLLKLILERAMG